MPWWSSYWSYAGEICAIFLPSFGGYRDVIGFGAYSTSTVIINVFYNMAPQFILARVLDFTAVGLYGRAINVTQVFERFVTRS